ncbi:MAG: BatD family protein [Solirubrobacterales bacterium]
MKVPTIALAVFSTVTSAGRLPAADGALRTEVDAHRIGLEDQVQLTITAEGAGSLPEEAPLPALTNLRLAGSPAVSTQMSFVNGRMSQARSWTYLLQPLAVGRAEVGAAKARFGSVEESAPAIPIEVVAGSVKPRAPARRPADPFGEDPLDSFFGRGRGRAAEPRLLFEASPSRQSLHVGEPLLLTYYLYTQTQVSNLQFSDAPQYAGFWVEELPRPERPSGEAATVDGVAYRRFPILVKLLFPTRAGRLTIPATTLSIGIPRQSFFDTGGVVQRSTKPINIEVKAIPDEPGFSGAVGRFKATAGIDRPTVALGEAATLRFKVEGSGNLKWIDRAPEVRVPGAKVYPPQTKSDLRAEPAGIAGSRTWEFVVVPETSGMLEIPSLAFSYFDPSSGRVLRSETAPLPLRVEAGTSAAGLPAPLPGPVAARRGGPLPLRADLDAGPLAGRILSGRTVALVAGFVLLLHATVWGAARMAEGRRRSEGRTAAPRSVRSTLRELGRAGADGMSKEAAAGLIERALHDLFGSVDGDDSERGRAVRQLLDEVHSVRYAPQLGNYSEKLRELAAKAGDVVRRWA